MHTWMKLGNLHRTMAILLTAWFFSACLENGGTCTNACRFMLDCRETRINRTLAPEEKRVELHDCRLQCRNGLYAGIWTEEYTDCVTASKGNCEAIDACPAASGLPEEAWGYVGYDTDYSWEDLLEGDFNGDPAELPSDVSDCVLLACYSDDLYCYDEFGERTRRVESCPNGCSEGRCY